MKKTMLLTAIAAVMCVFTATAQVKGDTTIAKKGLCHTYKRQGIEIYLLTEPANEYDVTGKVSSDDAASIINALNGTDAQQTLTEAVDALISNANRKAKKGKFSYDAIITEDGSTGTCIKWK